LDFRHYEVLDDAKDAIGRLGVWRLQGDAAVHGAVLKNAKADAVVMVVDLSKPWGVIDSLEAWGKVVEANGMGSLPRVVVGAKVDLCPEPQEGVIATLRRACVAHGQCGMIWLNLAKPTAEGRQLLRQAVEQAAGVRGTEVALASFLQPDLAEGLFVPPGWDSTERIEQALAEAPAVPSAPAAVVRKKEQEVVEAEPEAAFLLRHQKLLETLREEEGAQNQSMQREEQEVIDAPVTPAKGGSAGVTPPSTPGFATPTKTPGKTPSRPSAPASASAAGAGGLAVDGSDHAGLADFFNSLLAKDKSPYKGTPTK
jgi:hypothetical protein